MVRRGPLPAPSALAAALCRSARVARQAPPDRLEACRPSVTIGLAGCRSLSLRPVVAALDQRGGVFVRAFPPSWRWAAIPSGSGPASRKPPFAPAQDRLLPLGLRAFGCGPPPGRARQVGEHRPPPSRGTQHGSTQVCTQRTNANLV